MENLVAKQRVEIAESMDKGKLATDKIVNLEKNIIKFTNILLSVLFDIS